jgi:hypothetical protein
VFELGDGANVNLTVGGGSYDSEITWDLSDGSSGAAGSFDLTLDNGDSTLNMYDSWGDGWNGASAVFTDLNDGSVITTCSLDDGGAGECTVTIGNAGDNNGGNIVLVDNAVSNKDQLYRESVREAKEAALGLRDYENLVSRPTSINILTGEVVPGDNDGSRDVSFRLDVSCDACLDDGYGNLSPYSGFFTTSATDIQIFGFAPGSEACGTVTAINQYGDESPTSDAACANAGGCDDIDEDGICDDEDDCIGEDLGCGCNEVAYTCDDGTVVCDESDCAATGDVNGDGGVNVLDIVQTIDLILSASYSSSADMDGDGAITVLDIVQLVDVVLGGGRSADATSATMNVAAGTVSISGNGFIGAVQMTLSHDAGFSIDLTNDAMVADYRTNGNTTILVVVAPNSDEIFTATGDFKIEETIVASGNGYVPLSTPASFTLSAAYPNPFNPSTSLDMSIPSEGYVSVKAYNLAGQVVGTIAEGNMSAGTHSFTWDASDLSSGVYLVKAEYAGSIETQKVMLLK